MSKTENLHVRVPSEMKAALQKAAESRGTSVSELARGSLRQATNGGRALATQGDTHRIYRTEFAKLAGWQYENDRDVYKVAGYPDNYTFAEGWSRYKRQDIARRVVDLPVEATWKEPPIIREGEDGTDTEFTRAWYELWNRLNLQKQFQRADRMASIGEYSVVLLGLAGAATDRDLRTPADTLDGPDDVLFARPYKETDADINTFVRDANDTRFGHPETYQISLGGGDPNFQGKSVVVHWTRVLHIVEDPLDSEVYGLPRLQRVINRLIDLEKISASTAEAYWQLIVPIMKAIIDEDAGALTDAQLDDLEDDLLELVHDLRRHWIAQGINLEYLESDHAPDPSDAANLNFRLIAASMGIPMRVLIGTETGERASQQDERAFLSGIVSRQSQYAEPTFLRQVTDRWVMLGALPEPTEPYEFEWPDLRQDTEAEVAEVDASRASAAKSLTPVGGDPKELIEITDEGRVRLRPMEATANAANAVSDIDLTPTDGMKVEAQRGLDWVEEHDRGGTRVGRTTARLILDNELTPDRVVKMSAYFARHEVDKQADGFSPGEDGYPSNGRIAWALWGGDAGQTWSDRVSDRIMEEREGE